MAFKKERFAPAYTGGARIPRLFMYSSDEDTMTDIHKLGYFDEVDRGIRILLTPNSFVKVIAKDGTAEFVVEENRPQIKMRKSYVSTRWEEGRGGARVQATDGKGKFIKAKTG